MPDEIYFYLVNYDIYNNNNDDNNNTIGEAV